MNTKSALKIQHSNSNEQEKAISKTTEEIVIGMVGAVGAGVSTTSDALKKILEQEYGYVVEIIKAREIISENSEKSEIKYKESCGADQIKQLQSVGTDLRNRFGVEYIAAKSIERIALSRAKNEDGYDKSTQVPRPNSLRRATIIDSLKHPHESKLLREVYGEMYFQFTVFAPERIREQRLKAIGVEKEKLSGIFTRDNNDIEDDHGQKVSKTAHLSDFFLRNDGENDERLKEVLDRFLRILFNISVHTPTQNEAAMNSAVEAASNSACLSRQVGAALYSNEGELIGIGWNDVPKSSGGLYTVEDNKKDHRCFKWGLKHCHNDYKKDELYSKIFKRLNQDKLLVSNVSEGTLRTALLATPVKDLIEYSRSIHAEMEALISAARTGKNGVVGGTLFTTTFPCHNCARHIVAAGISRVFYIEPYAKSLAFELHGDSISDTESDPDKVAFLQYEGIGPNSSRRLFRHGIERKNGGSAILIDKKKAVPVLPPSMEGFTTHEKRVIQRLASVEDTPLA